MSWSRSGWGGDDNGWTSGAATPPTLATWNPSDKNSNVDLSGGNLIATRSVGYDGSFYGVRATLGHSSGKYFFSAVDGVDNTNRIGLANASADISSTIGGDNNNSIVYGGGDGGLILNKVGIGNGALYTTGDVLDFAIDLSAQLIWVRVNGGNWNTSGTANPTTGVGGFSFAGIAAGPFFPAAWFFVGSAAFTANFGATSYTYAAPSGFGNF